MSQPQLELWNRLDPGTAALVADEGETRYWLLITEREARALLDGDVEPRVKVALTRMLLSLKEECALWARQRAENA